MAKALPASGSNESVLREYLKHPDAPKLLMLYGTFGDDHTARITANRFARLGIHLTVGVIVDEVHQLYHLACKQWAAEQRAAKKEPAKKAA